jgi:hypothetical protein
MTETMENDLIHDARRRLAKWAEDTSMRCEVCDVPTAFIITVPMLELLMRVFMLVGMPKDEMQGMLGQLYDRERKRHDVQRVPKRATSPRH